MTRCYFSLCGFVGGKSTTTNLTIFKNFLADSLDRGVQVDVIHTDFSKAFDQVDHSILLNKLKYYGIDRSIFSLMKSYLTDRTQAVILQSVESNVILVLYYSVFSSMILLITSNIVRAYYLLTMRNCSREFTHSLMQAIVKRT